MNNNLFQYATSELSQDAFICWLLSYAIKGCDKDEALTACAKEFLRFFIPECESEDVFLSEPPQRQYKRIDVLITVNDRYKVIIEDKTHTREHSNQLMHYRETVRADFPAYQQVGVYYKTGFQSDLTNVNEAGYLVCDRETILSILGKHIHKTTNNIFLDYYEHLNEFNNRVLAFKELPVSQWGWEQINGFYQHCQNTLTDTGMQVGFGYIANKSGGFDGMWIWKPLYVDADGLTCEVYLQCGVVNGKLSISYRASSKTDPILRNNRDALVWKNKDGTPINVAEEHNFTKPPRYSTGKSVALGVYRATASTAHEAVDAIRNAIGDFYKLVTVLQE